MNTTPLASPTINGLFPKSGTLQIIASSLQGDLQNKIEEVHDYQEYLNQIREEY